MGTPQGPLAVLEISKVAESLGIKVATLALAWVLQNPIVSAPIIGASSPAQLSDTVAALQVTLEPETMVALDVITRHFRYGDADR